MPSDPTTPSSPATPTCPWCGYSLSGLVNIGPHAPQVCPECGGDVRDAGFALARTHSRIRQRRLRIVMLITSFAAYAFLLIMSIVNGRMPNARWILATAIATLTVLIPTAFALVSRAPPLPSTLPPARSEPLRGWRKGFTVCALIALYLIVSGCLTLAGIVLSIIISARL